MKVIPIPANEDNYQYLIIDSATNQSAIVDPVHLSSIHSTVKESGSQLVSALVTHHHWDHAGGTGQLAKEVPGVRIYGGDANRIDSITDTLTKQGEKFRLGELDVTPLLTPCHTSTHVCYYLEDGGTGERAVFTGDTLFIAGCGRFFEGGFWENEWRSAC